TSNMPRKKRKGGRGGIFCGCFGAADEPPDIQLNMTDAMAAPVAIETYPPMPSPSELKAKFAEFVDELDLPSQNRQAMFDLAPEKQWQIYCSKKKEQEDPNKLATSWPDYYIDRLNSMSTIMVLMYDEEEIEMRLKLVDGLKTALRTQPVRFVVRFAELDGISCLLNFLKNMVPEVRESRIHTSAIGCIKALMNNTQGRANVLAHPDGINVIAQSLACESLRTKTAVLEILGAVCLVPGGHKKVLEAMLHYQKYSNERTRFQNIVNELALNHHSPEDDTFEVNMKTAAMSFLNALINCGAGEDHLEFRCHLRYELLLLGIQPIMEQLREYENELLNKHLDFFEMVRREDDEEIASRFDAEHIDTKSAGDMFDFIQKKLCFTEAYPHLLSLLHHCMLIPLNRGGAPYHWQLFDRVVQQITLQKLDGADPDVTFLRDFNLEKCLKLLINENEIKKWKDTAETMRKKHDEMKGNLDRKERECEAKGKEQEELMKTVNILKGKLDAESKERLSSDQKLTDMTQHVEESLQEAIKLGTSPSIPITPSTAIAPPPPPPLAPPMGGPPPPPPPLAPPMSGGPPPPPPMMGAPPPPAPPGMGAPKGLPKKNIPKAPNPLKSFNWLKLSDTKITGTIWTELDDSKAFKCIDLPDLDNTFSAYQRQQVSKYAHFNICIKYGSQEDLSIKKVKELSVIDGRRAQNCTILLTRLKLTDDEIRKAVLSCDQSEDLQKDMMEQLIKFIPTKEETDMLNEHKADMSKMARADKFLCQMSQIHHYEQRMHAIFYKKKFHERLSEIQPKVEGEVVWCGCLYGLYYRIITPLYLSHTHCYSSCRKNFQYQSSQTLTESSRNDPGIGQLHEQGSERQRIWISNCRVLVKWPTHDSKFERNFIRHLGLTQPLLKIPLKKNVTLMHFLIEMLEKHSPDIINLPDDLKNVETAARVNLGELEKEMNILRLGLKNLKTELGVQEKQVSSGQSLPGDRFVPVMTDFVTIASVSFTETEEKLTESKTKFNKVVELFGEDPKRLQPDAFFNLFTDFMASFNSARKDNISQRKKKDDEIKRKHIYRISSSQREDERKKRKIGSRKQSEDQRGEFDDLVSALRSGEVFEKDVSKFQKRNRLKRPPSSLDDRERVVSKITT
uniref:GBD/FH3 domain-containing protein n=1 Tax=Ciona savignyi TaxID=51511 RepID=H2YP92_CIOSA